jgi:hypothetical protein
LSAQGVISESLISFNITWSNPGKGQQSKWDQTKQGIEIHETDVYPDLQYTSAYAAPLYIKYTSGALLNDLISEINKIIDARIAGESNKTNEAKGELPSGPDAPKQLGSGEEDEEDEEDEETQKALPSGPDAPKQLAGYSPGGDLVKVEEPGLPAIIDTKPEEVDVPDVTPDETAAASDYAYTVVVKGDRLRFLEGQQERGAYSAGVKFLYQVSNNLSKVVSGETIDNKTKIWAEISMSGLLGRTFRMEFPEFDEKEFKFGGNLLAQILPSIELSFTPDQNSVYSKEKPELDIADVIKATNITLGSKTTSEIKALQKQIQKEIEAREPSQSEGSSDKQVASDKNK